MCQLRKSCELLVTFWLDWVTGSNNDKLKPQLCRKSKLSPVEFGWLVLGQKLIACGWGISVISGKTSHSFEAKKEKLDRSFLRSP
jgi:hypothetical protein